jgi:hypothetical protein
MKTLFILASVMVVLFLAAPNRVEAQGSRTAFLDTTLTLLFLTLPEIPFRIALGFDSRELSVAERDCNNPLYS